MRGRCLASLLCAAFFAALVVAQETSRARLLLVTVANEETDGLRRLRRSADAFNIALRVFGLDEQLNDDLSGGAEKLRFLREGMEAYKDRSELLVLYVDSEGTVLNADEKVIVENYLKYYGEHRIVFAADGESQPEEAASSYPAVDAGRRFLCSSMFMGHAPEVWKMLNSKTVADSKGDLQLFFSSVYLDANLRRALRMSLDSTSRVFQSLEGALDNIALEFTDGGDAVVHNLLYSTYPVVIFGDRKSKLYMNYLGNYLGRTWSADSGCRLCQPVGDYAVLKNGTEGNWPTVMLALFLPKPVPFVKEFLEVVEGLNYPPSKIDLYIFNNQKYNKKQIEEFSKNAKGKYRSVEVDNVDENMEEREARRNALELAMKSSSEFVMLLDADAHFTDSDVLRALVDISLSQNVGILAPLLSRPYKLYSNFWGALTNDGFYARSEDYSEIVYGQRIGLWNVPYITSAILISNDKMSKMRAAFTYVPDADTDMSFCQLARDEGHFLFVDNERYYGFLVDSDTFDNSGLRKNPEMYQIFENRYLWEHRYINPEYFDVLNGSGEVPQPCPDVYDYPLMSEQFAKELIEEMEHFGKWSGGKHQDERITGGYENVPTVDIHMNQIGFERQWLFFLDEYVRPMQEKLFIGFYHKPVDSIMMFVVRYKPGEQPYLRPHHDASTYTIDVPLNKRGVDYEGGGIRYIRYNCTVAADQVGYAAMFPGRLTHLHEGLPTTKGVRYIAVSFLIP